MVFFKHVLAQNWKLENLGGPEKFSFRKSADLSTHILKWQGVQDRLVHKVVWESLAYCDHLYKRFKFTKTKGKSTLIDYSLNDPEVLQAKTTGPPCRCRFFFFPTPLHARHMDLTGSFTRWSGLLLSVVLSLSSDEHLHLLLSCTTQPQSSWPTCKKTIFLYKHCLSQKIFYPKKCVNYDKSDLWQNSLKIPKDPNSTTKCQEVI